MAGIIKQSKNKLILTSLGKELTQDKNQSRLFSYLIKTYATQFNWGYRDAYPAIDIIQIGWLFSLYCLLLFGNKWRSCHFYSGKFLDAFPSALDNIDEKPYMSIEEQFHNCYRARMLERFARFFGGIEIRKPQDPSPMNFEFEVRAPHLSEWLQFHA